MEIIEHLDKQRGQELLKEALRVCRVVIVTTPKRFNAQGEELGNPYEVHRSRWAAADLKRVGHVWIWPHRRELIAAVARRREDLAPVARARPVMRFLARQARKLRGIFARRGRVGRQ